MRTPRQRIVDVLDHYGECGYIDKNTVSARCPLCDDVLAVRFAHRKVMFDCVYNHCDELEIAEALFDRDVADKAHRQRLIDLLMAGLDDAREDWEEAA